MKRRRVWTIAHYWETRCRICPPSCKAQVVKRRLEKLLSIINSLPSSRRPYRSKTITIRGPGSLRRRIRNRDWQLSHSITWEGSELISRSSCLWKRWGAEPTLSARKVASPTRAFCPRSRREWLQMLQLAHYLLYARFRYLNCRIKSRATGTYLYDSHWTPGQAL